MSDLTARQQAAAIGAFTAAGRIPRLREALADGLDSGLTINEIKRDPGPDVRLCGFPALATVAALATLDGLESQLRSHFVTALNTGLTGAGLRGLITVPRERVGGSAADRAGAVLDNVLN